MSGQVHVYTTPLFPAAVFKSGKQGWLWEEDLGQGPYNVWVAHSGRLRHPNIVRALAKVLPHDTPEQPDQPGFIAMELLGKSLKESDGTRSAVMPTQQSDVSFIYIHKCLQVLGPIGSLV